MMPSQLGFFTASLDPLDGFSPQEVSAVGSFDTDPHKVQNGPLLVINGRKTSYTWPYKRSAGVISNLYLERKQP